MHCRQSSLVEHRTRQGADLATQPKAAKIRPLLGRLELRRISARGTVQFQPHRDLLKDVHGETCVLGMCYNASPFSSFFKQVMGEIGRQRGGGLFYQQMVSQ